MKQVGTVEIPQEAFLAVLQVGRKTKKPMLHMLMPDHRRRSPGSRCRSTLLCVVDDWFLRPRRQHRRGAAAAPPIRRCDARCALPGAAGADRRAVLRGCCWPSGWISALVLVAITASPASSGARCSCCAPRRDARGARPPARIRRSVPEPGTVDYARSFFPVALVVLVLRSFIFEPFRIPSDSMMPTLLDGDFIIVNKYAYGLRLPVLNQKFVPIGEPQRGDVVVFRYPPDPSVNYIKRLVGLPGDRVEVRDDRIYRSTASRCRYQLDRSATTTAATMNMRLAARAARARTSTRRCSARCALDRGVPLPSCRPSAARGVHNLRVRGRGRPPGGGRDAALRRRRARRAST